MASTAVSVCSNALLLLGQKPIASLGEQNDMAQLCNNLFPAVREEILRDHPWNCCIKRRNLAPDAEAPEFDFAYKFRLPEDWLRTLQVGTTHNPIEFRAEGRYLLADANPLPLRYVFNNTDVGSWDTKLIQCCTLLMAARMAYPVTASASMRESMLNEYLLAAKRARAIDGLDEPPEQMPTGSMYDSRFTSSARLYR